MENNKIDSIINSLSAEDAYEIKKLKKQNRYLEKLLEVTHQISTSDLMTILKLVIKSIVEITKANRGFLMLLDDTDELTFKNIVTTDDVDQQKSPFNISESIVKNVIKTGKGELIDSVPDNIDYKDSKSILKLQLQAVMCVPLMIKKRVIGVIYVDSDTNIMHFSREGLKLFEAFASQAAIAIENAELVENLKKENLLLKREVQGSYQFGEIICQSKKMKHLLQLLNHVLDNSITVLIQGETGTGKELIARAIHYNSIRKDKRFIAQNCACLPDSLLESELFGHKKGAFTGAIEDKIGLFESANGGTIFLDEIGETSQALQVRLLRVLETQTIRRIGENSDRKIDVRIIAATNRDLQEEVKKGQFREDLYYRLSAFPVYIPPLRERKEDITVLVQHFIDHYNEKLGKNIEHASQDFIDNMMAKDWQGNIRELKNYIYRMMILSPSNTLISNDTVIHPNTPQAAVNTTPTVEDITEVKKLESVEKEYIEKILKSVNGNQTKAAKLLGLKRGTLISRMKKLEIKSTKNKSQS